MDTELRHLEIVAFVECSYAEIVALFGPPIKVRGHDGWLRDWNGRTFLISDGDPPARCCSGDYQFMLSSDDRDAGHGFAVYFADAVYCDRLTRGMMPV